MIQRTHDELRQTVRRPFSLGFSLAELLVVIALIVLLISLMVPSISSVVLGSELARGGQAVADAISLARQEAVAKNRHVEIRFILAKRPDSTTDKETYHAMQTWISDPQTGKTTPLSRVYQLPGPICIATDPSLSPLIQSPPAAGGTTDFGGSFGNRPYRSLKFRPNGSLSSTIGAEQSHLTVLHENHVNDGAPPANYFVIGINPVSGKVTVWRP